MNIHKVHRNARRIAALALVLVMATASAALAETKSEVAHQNTGSAGQLTTPWAVKAGDKVLAYVATKEAGMQIATGLRLHYYTTVQMQQEAEIDPWISVEKVLDDSADGQVVKTTRKAVADIVRANDKLQSKDEEPLVGVTYAKTAKVTQSVAPKVKVIETDSLGKGETKVKDSGEQGSRYIESEVVQVNAKVVTENVMMNEVVKKPTTKVVYRGTEVSTESKGKTIAAFAKKFLGNTYVWGGESLTEGCDCSGYMMKLYEHYGISIPHYSDDQGTKGVEVKHDEMLPGDLIIYPGHVAMYIGEGKIIHASGPSVGIIISDESQYASRIKHIRRLFDTDIDKSTDDMFPTVAEIEKAYKAEDGFGEGNGYSAEYTKEKGIDATFASHTDKKITPVGPPAGNDNTDWEKPAKGTKASSGNSGSSSKKASDSSSKKKDSSSGKSDGEKKSSTQKDNSNSGESTKSTNQNTEQSTEQNAGAQSEAEDSK